MEKLGVENLWTVVEMMPTASRGGRWGPGGLGVSRVLYSDPSSGRVARPGTTRSPRGRQGCARDDGPDDTMTVRVAPVVPCARVAPALSARGPARRSGRGPDGRGDPRPPVDGVRADRSAAARGRSVRVGRPTDRLRGVREVTTAQRRDRSRRSRSSRPSAWRSWRPSGTAQFIALSATLALLVGIVHISIGVLRLGFVMRFLSEPVMTGFLAAVGILLMATQLGPLTGVSVPNSSRAFEIVSRLVDGRGRHEHRDPCCSVYPSIVVLVALRKYRRFPSALVLVVTATAVSAIVDFASHGIAVVGSVPSGLAGFKVPVWNWNDIEILLPTAFAITLISVLESLALGRRVRRRTRVRDRHQPGDRRPRRQQRRRPGSSRAWSSRARSPGRRSSTRPGSRTQFVRRTLRVRRRAAPPVRDRTVQRHPDRGAERDRDRRRARRSSRCARRAGCGGAACRLLGAHALVRRHPRTRSRGRRARRRRRVGRHHRVPHHATPHPRARPDPRHRLLPRARTSPRRAHLRRHRRARGPTRRSTSRTPSRSSPGSVLSRRIDDGSAHRRARRERRRPSRRDRRP